MPVTNPANPGRKTPRSGIKVVDNADDPVAHPGVNTTMGRAGYLLAGNFADVEYLELLPDTYIPEYPHEAECILYTVKGKWVLCSERRRRIVEPGTLCRVEAGTDVGYEVPFDGPSFVLIFRASEAACDEDRFVDYLAGLAFKLKARQYDKNTCRISDLPEEHPAKVFARSLDQIRPYEQYGKN